MQKVSLSLGLCQGLTSPISSSFGGLRAALSSLPRSSVSTPAPAQAQQAQRMNPPG